MPSTRTRRRRPLGPRIQTTDRGERAKLALARARRITGLTNRMSPLGWRRVYYQRLGRDVAYPDHRERITMRYIRALRNSGLSFGRIAKRLEAVLARREGRPPHRYSWLWKYDRWACRRRFLRCIALCGSGRPGDEGQCRGKRNWPLGV